MKSKLEYSLTLGCQILFNTVLMYDAARMPMSLALELQMPSNVTDFSGFYLTRFSNFIAIILGTI